MHDAREGDDRHFARTAANVDDHRTRRLRNGKPDTDRRRHRFLDEKDFARTRVMRRLFDRALLDFGDARGYRHDEPRLDLQVMRDETRRTDLLDEVLEHRLGDVEVGDDARLHRTDRDDVARRTTEHATRLLTDGQYALRARLNRHHGRFAQHNATIFRINERIRRTEVDTDVC